MNIVTIPKTRIRRAISILRPLFTGLDKDQHEVLVGIGPDSVTLAACTPNGLAVVVEGGRTYDLLHVVPLHVLSEVAKGPGGLVFSLGLKALVLPHELARHLALDPVPLVPAPKMSSVRVLAEDLAAGLDKVKGIASKDAARGDICSVLCELRAARGLRLTATNGYICTRTVVKTPPPHTPDVDRALLTPDFCLAAQRLLAKAGPPGTRATVAWLEDGQLEVRAGQSFVRAPFLPGGKYPNVDNVIDKPSRPACYVDRRALLTAARALDKARRDKLEPVILDIGAIGVSIGRAQHTPVYLGQGVSPMADPVRIGLDPVLLACLLRSCKGDTIALYVTDTLSPTYLDDSDDGSTLRILMPTRL